MGENVCRVFLFQFESIIYWFHIQILQCLPLRNVFSLKKLLLVHGYVLLLLLLAFRSSACLDESPALQFQPFSSHFALSKCSSNFCSWIFFCATSLSKSPNQKNAGCSVNQIIPASLQVYLLCFLECPIWVVTVEPISSHGSPDP